MSILKNFKAFSLFLDIVSFRNRTINYRRFPWLDNFINGHQVIFNDNLTRKLDRQKYSHNVALHVGYNKRFSEAKRDLTNQN